MSPVGASSATLPCRGAKVFVRACSVDFMPFLPARCWSKRSCARYGRPVAFYRGGAFEGELSLRGLVRLPKPRESWYPHRMDWGMPPLLIFQWSGLDRV